jgi:hypothetical protein
VIARDVRHVIEAEVRVCMCVFAETEPHIWEITSMTVDDLRGRRYALAFDQTQRRIDLHLAESQIQQNVQR